MTTDSAISARSHIWTMAVTHQAFRREFELAPRIVRDISPDEHDRQRVAADWFATMLGFMHHHHENEDLLMYPLLAGRIEQPLLELMNDQHRQLAAAIDRAEARLAGWRLDDPATGESLAAAFDDMLPVLVEHVDAEEQQVMPLVADLLTADEYARQGTRGSAGEPVALMMTFGSVVEQASAAEGAYMLAYPPEQVRRAWHEWGAEEYRRTMELLRGGLEPIARHPAPPGQSLDDAAVTLP